MSLSLLFTSLLVYNTLLLVYDTSLLVYDTSLLAYNTSLLVFWYIYVWFAETMLNATSPGYRQFYEFLQVDWAIFLTYSLKMECTYFLKARELPC